MRPSCPAQHCQILMHSFTAFYLQFTLEVIWEEEILLRHKKSKRKGKEENVGKKIEKQKTKKGNRSEEKAQ